MSIDKAWEAVQTALPEGWAVLTIDHGWEFGEEPGPSGRFEGRWLDSWSVYANGRPEDSESGQAYGNGATLEAALWDLARGLG